MNKILLGKSKSKKDVNEDNFMNVELFSTERALPVESITQTLDSYEEYLKEKDSSKIYRLIFTINPVCSNVLFNACTEMVYKEGSDSCKVLSSGTAFSSSEEPNMFNYLRNCKGMGNQSSTAITLTRREAILDTAFSHESIGPLVYHCGVDIFDNHTLRNKEFKVVNKEPANTTNEAFNTIRDYLRDANGNVIKEKILKMGSSGLKINQETSLHLYQVDEVRTFQESIHDNLVESEGWYGFINPASMAIVNYIDANNNEITINKCMNNNKAGEFIDMYPDRSLYSFVPKYNKYRNRYELNWDYVMTYPYSSTTDNELVSNGDVNGIKCTFYNIEKELGNCYFAKHDGETNFTFHLKTQLKNTFYNGSFVNFTFISGNTIVETNTPIKVEGTGADGDDTQHVFSINFNSIVGYLMEFLGTPTTTSTEWARNLKRIEIRVRKHVKGLDCKYYIREFKKIPCPNGKFSSSINKLAFAENIYSDKMAQIVFNDDINVYGLTDNLGRDLSEIYLTIVKRNKGHEKWYSGFPNFTDEDIEFSHCFGKVSAGFDLSADEENIKYNIHRLTANNRSTNAVKIEESGVTYGVNITDEDEKFAGDIVEFSPFDVEETVLEDVYHRFNTAQRETVSSLYSTIRYSDFKQDDYDVIEDFNIAESIYNHKSQVNISNEGYYYKPHYKVKIMSFSETVKQGSHTKVYFIDGIQTVSENVYSGATNVPYNIYVGDTLYLIDPENGERKEAEVVSVAGPLRTEITFSVNEEIDITKYNVYIPNSLMPYYAYELNDGTGRYLWREPLKESKLMYNDELYDTMFTNGAHYFHENINFFLRRQDPYGEYGLNNGQDIDAMIGTSKGLQKDVSFAEYQREGKNDLC